MRLSLSVRLPRPGRFSGAVATLALSSGLLVQSTGGALAAPPPTAAYDGSDRAAVINGFYDTWLANEQGGLGWTGDAATCQAGAPSAPAADQARDQINYFRWMNGLGPITLDPALSQKAQAAALIMDAQDDLDHHPPATWACWTQDGYDGAGNSNLAWSSATYAGGGVPVTQWMQDTGQGNEAAGHRRWILDPTMVTSGIGLTNQASAMWTLPTGSPRSTPASSPTWLPWPTPGYFPATFQTGGRWSLSASGSAVDFGNAVVSVTGPAGPVSVVKNPVANGYGPNTLVWEMGALPTPAMGASDTYRVTVAGIVGAAVTSYSYDVVLVTPDRELAVTTAPLITGTARFGQTLQASVADFTPAASSVSGQWLRNGQPIAGATGPRYLLTASDIGATISYRATAKRRYYKDTVALSAGTPPVQKGLATLSTAATVSATAPTVGSSVTVSGGTWNPTGSRSIQWSIDGAAITGATSASYAPTVSDLGKMLTVTITSRSDNYEDATATLAAGVVGLGTQTATSPGSANKPAVGSMVTLSGAEWTPSESRSVQWQLNGQAIPGATTSNYTPHVSDLGKELSVLVISSAAGYADARLAVVAGTVAPGRYGVVTKARLIGKAKVGATLRVRPGTYSSTPSKVVYRWTKNGKVVPRKVGTTFRVRASDRGSKIGVRVTVTAVGYAPLIFATNAIRIR